ncbi:adenosylcobinamide-phosphate synthase CbiB [Rubrobacter aplysinae]|uniref:adenosylcobinamide-phosphate synthase CbiB n=1 Tax=Rubrobacter aplysinae TaxID=909625 RepID=UPI00064C39E1|nr:adenosylcobinamide-phosphate synthase CbiB [Rubrobacter aplysinae]
MSHLAPASLLVDAALGEPPARLHPTVWMGEAAAAFDRLGHRAESRDARRLVGLAAAIAVPVASWTLTAALLGLVSRRLRPLVESGLVSLALSMRGLAAGAEAVAGALEREDLESARRRAGEIVGRDTEELSGAELARAAVESVAENTSDGVVAPMLFAALWGAPGAMAYRAVNTLDSMLGYRRGVYRDLGLAPARLDDLANLLPARLTVLAVAAVSGSPLRTVRLTRRYGALHPSPNAGWAEAAFAGALGLMLGGDSRYGGEVRTGPVIGEGRRPGPGDIRRAIRLMRRACFALGLALCSAEIVARG